MSRAPLRVVVAAVVAVATTLLAACGTATPHAAGSGDAGSTGSRQRVVVLDIAGSIGDTVYGLGLADLLVGRDVAVDFPGADKLPVVTKDGHTINSEAVIKLDPTMVITDGSIGPKDVVEQLKDVGIDVEFVDNDASFAGAAQLAREVAKVLGAPAKGEELATRITTEVDAAKADIAKEVPAKPLRMVFLYMRGQVGVYYIFGKEEGVSDLIQGVGGVDVAAEEGWGSMVPLTDEAIVAARPDVILAMDDGLASVGGIDGLLSSKPAIALTPAGKDRRFVTLPDTEILSFGPNSAQTLRDLAAKLYGSQP